jgi:hypothetical protein
MYLVDDGKAVAQYSGSWIRKVIHDDGVPADSLRVCTPDLKSGWQHPKFFNLDERF